MIAIKAAKRGAEREIQIPELNIVAVLLTSISMYSEVDGSTAREGPESAAPSQSEMQVAPADADLDDEDEFDARMEVDEDDDEATLEEEEVRTDCHSKRDWIILDKYLACALQTLALSSTNMRFPVPL